MCLPFHGSVRLWDPLSSYAACDSQPRILNEFFGSTNENLSDSWSILGSTMISSTLSFKCDKGVWDPLTKSWRQKCIIATMPQCGDTMPKMSMLCHNIRQSGYWDNRPAHAFLDAPLWLSDKFYSGERCVCSLQKRSFRLDICDYDNVKSILWITLCATNTFFLMHRKNLSWFRTYRCSFG